MIAFRWKRASDGEPLARIRIEHRCTRQDLADLLIAAQEPHLTPDLADLPRAEIERRIRGQLWFNRDAAHWWGDNYPEDDGYVLEGEVSATQAAEWAARQVAKL